MASGNMLNRTRSGFWGGFLTVLLALVCFALTYVVVFPAIDRMQQDDPAPKAPPGIAVTPEPSLPEPSPSYPLGDDGIYDWPQQG